MTTEHDPINHPKHYAAMPAEVSPIDVTRYLPNNLGCAVKYLLRAGKKEGNEYKTEIGKAIWYLQDHLEYIGEGQRQNVALAVWRLVKKEKSDLLFVIPEILKGNVRTAIYFIEDHIKKVM